MTDMKPASRQREPSFQVRDSPFTVAMRDPNHQATFSLFLAGQALLASATLVLYFFDRDQFHSDLDTFVRIFSPIQASFLLEVICTAAVLLLLPAVRMERSILRAVVYPLVVTFTALIIIMTPVILRNVYNTHPVLSCGMCMQQIRFIMKIISFLSENGPGSQAQVKDENENNNDFYSPPISDPEGQVVISQSKPTISSLIYFMFAPTLIYQHSYPRYPNPTNWLMVVVYMVQWLLLLIPSILLMNHQMLPLWSEIGVKAITPHFLYHMFLWSIVMSGLFWLGIGYCFLHCWLNMWAEMLRFGDRMFYKNWWSARNGLHAWGLWNYMIHLWIARYIFIPCIKRTKSRIFALLYTFTISAFFHDYLISFAVGFFFPYLLMVVIFVVTPATPVFLLLNYFLKFIPLPPTNVHVFVGAILSIAIGMMAAVFEYNSRQNCPMLTDSFWHTVLVPRSFSCLSFDFRLTWIS